MSRRDNLWTTQSRHSQQSQQSQQSQEHHLPDKAPFMALADTYSNLFQTHSISRSHLVSPLCSLHHSSRLPFFPFLPRRPPHPRTLLARCHGHYTHTDMPADVLKPCQIRQGRGAVAVSRRSDWTAPERKQTTVSWPP
ncbi:hypothetical protein PBY51_005467 [Eleginops maclovinus]|uniref:Uncharacterized protein n=1 Tax=Eleginops maclovinus TaxID=56733 RepID=A0AAN7X8F6_ELEMC|nr:hypothetical protein PBY51_005467 [Eleginops maclovinus]